MGKARRFALIAVAMAVSGTLSGCAVPAAVGGMPFLPMPPWVTERIRRNYRTKMTSAQQ